MKATIYILVFFLAIFFTACKAPKNTLTDTKQKEQKNIENNISLVEASILDEVVSQAMQKFFTEKLHVNINNKIYDTEKPADPETGKPPLKEETNLNLSKETNEATNEKTETKKSEATASSLEDKSKDKSKFEVSGKTKTEKGFTLWAALGLSVAASLIIGFIIFLIGKFK